MKILVVDDSRATQVIVRRVIQQLPYSNISIANADNGASGLELIRTWEPDLVISDWHMPEMTGIEMLIAFKREMLNIPVGFISTDTAAEKKQEAFDSGAAFYVEKPFKAEDLQSAIIPLIETHINYQALKEAENKKTGSYSKEKISLLIKLIKEFSNDSVSVKPIEASYLEHNQFPCVLALFETKSDHGIKALMLFDHNASCIIESTLKGKNARANDISGKKIDQKTVIQCKLLANNINQAILRDDNSENFHLRSITIIDDNIETIEGLMKKSWNNRIDLNIQYNNEAKGVITLIST